MKKLLIGLAVLLALVLIIGLFLPTKYSVENEITIKGTPAQVHAFVGDLKRWPEWTPWEEDDPTVVTTCGEQTTGVGATQSWTSESSDGELTLTASDPATGIAYDMNFIMDGERVPATCAMGYSASGDSTVVTWSMEGDIGDMLPPVISGYVGLLMPGQISGAFQRGLTKLKSKVEAGD